MNHKLAPLTGVLFFALLAAGIFVEGFDTPNTDDSATKVLAYYQAHDTRIGISALLTVLAVFVGVIFYGMLRDYLRRNEGMRGLTATAFGGVVLFAASGCLGAGANFALVDAPSHLTAASAQTLHLIGMDVGEGFSSAGLAIMLAAFGLAILQSRLLPRWLGWAALPVALVALIPPIAFAAFPLGALWTLAISIAMWRRVANAEAAVA
jgi:hypothetical protein